MDAHQVDQIGVFKRVSLQRGNSLSNPVEKPDAQLTEASQKESTDPMARAAEALDNIEVDVGKARREEEEIRGKGKEREKNEADDAEAAKAAEDEEEDDDE